jgi:hypothetical protein
MAGLQLIPMTLIAAVVCLFLTSEVGLIHSQRRREGAFEEGTTDTHALSDNGKVEDSDPLATTAETGSTSPS